MRLIVPNFKISKKSLGFIPLVVVGFFNTCVFRGINTNILFFDG